MTVGGVTKYEKISKEGGESKKETGGVPKKGCGGGGGRASWTKGVTGEAALIHLQNRNKEGRDQEGKAALKISTVRSHGI